MINGTTTVEGSYLVEFEYGYELDHHPTMRTGKVKITLSQGSIQGAGSDLAIEGTYEMNADGVISMDVIAKPPFWDPVKKGEEMFFLRGRVSPDYFVLSRPIGDDPRLFARAKFRRMSDDQKV